jgi:hypothetical protein
LRLVFLVQFKLVANHERHWGQTTVTVFLQVNEARKRAKGAKRQGPGSNSFAEFENLCRAWPLPSTPIIAQVIHGQTLTRLR